MSEFLSRTSETPTDGPGAPPMRVISVENAGEFALVAHVRGWCHHGDVCQLCKAQDRAFAAERELESIISG